MVTTLEVRGCSSQCVYYENTLQIKREKEIFRQVSGFKDTNTPVHLELSVSVAWAAASVFVSGD